MKGDAMLSSHELYPLVLIWLRALDAAPRPLATAGLAHLVVALLTAQSLRPSALMRALLSPTPVPARQRYQRLARSWGRPWLTSAWLTPRLVRAVTTLAPTPQRGPTAGLTHLVLDSVRCGRWEVFTLGVLWHGRIVPVNWAVLPSPWPSGQVTPAVCRRVREVAAVWPSDRPVHLLADRAFPSQPLFRTLRAVGWGWTVRLRAPLPVTVDGVERTVRDLLGQARRSGWTVWTGAEGRGRTALPATLVVGRGLPVWPLHQRTEGSQRARAQQQAERQRVKGYDYATVGETDAWVALCATHTTWHAAVCSYKGRYATEGSYRDAQGGWDGQHGWDLEPVLAQARTATHAAGVVGLWALGALVQTWIGSQVVHGPAPVRAVAAQWTVTGRLSVWAHGQFALRESSGRLHDWLEQTLRTGAARLATVVLPHAGLSPGLAASSMDPS